MTAWEINKSCVNIWMKGSIVVLGMEEDGQGVDVVGYLSVFGFVAFRTWIEIIFLDINYLHWGPSSYIYIIR